MKMLAYGVNEEEREFFDRYGAEYGFELTLMEEKPSLRNLDTCRGMDVVNVLSDVPFTDEMYEKLRSLGVGIVVTRTIGYEHLHPEIAGKYGIKTANITYSPASVADYAIMMMLMSLRHIKPMLLRYAAQDYTQDGFRGREMHSLTIGIIGTGRIGEQVIRELGGFGARILCTSRRQKQSLKGLAEYVDEETLLRESDIVSLHLALTEETLHYMGKERLARMKEGAVLVNTARGGLVDSSALIEALRSGRLGAAALDMVDGDRLIYYRDFKNRMVPNEAMAILSAMPNVLMLPHMAYYTKEASEDMVGNSLLNALKLMRGEDCEFRLS